MNTELVRSSVTSTPSMALLISLAAAPVILTSKVTKKRMAIDIEPVSDDSAETKTGPDDGKDGEDTQYARDTSMHTPKHL